MELDKHYNPRNVEDKWYKHWMEKGYFNSKPDSREPFTIVIPPPNVTGVLHMGHMLNNTIQDVLIRKARMEGKNACWVPGTDHASIATEAKVVKMLAEQGVKKNDIGREAFLGHAWEWKEKYGGIILEQLKKLGASCDWNRTRFTMEEDLSNAVTEVFVKMYEDGLIYRGTRMVNWDPVGKTTLSDEEVIFKENNSQLFYVTYPFSDSTKQTLGAEGGLTVATTRPETIMGDVAICVHPEDERYRHLVGKTVMVPIVNREVTVIADDYIDMEFGTGCLKVTPAHDENDYRIGEKHHLEAIDVLTEDGKISERAGVYIGMDRFACRKQIVKDLEELGLISKTEQIKNTVGHSERTDAVIEKRISTQWFVDMQEFMKRHPQVLDSVMNDEIRFHPSKFKNVYKHWMENIKDWNISRQLWWGHRIPAWYDSNGNFVVAVNEQEAHSKFASEFPDIKVDKLRQDEDVLDTWFSSWLWPISVFDGFKDKNNADYNYYYPTNDLVTGPDIIFFWVARMIMAGYAFNGRKPFSNVYFTGIIRDKLRRKMSKSLGNSPDPLELIEKYGADSVRLGILLSSPAGNDILYDESQVEQGRNFCNKIWNAYRLIAGWQVHDAASSQGDILAGKWFNMKFRQSVDEIHSAFADYRLNEALMSVYKLIWDDFCSNYLEMVKPSFGDPVSSETLVEVKKHFDSVLGLLHPFMPFISEELHSALFEGKPEKALIVSEFPEAGISFEVINDQALQVITELRNMRNSKGLSPKHEFEVILNTETPDIYGAWESIIKKLGNVTGIEFNTGKPEKYLNALIGKDEMFVPFAEEIDEEAEKKRIEEELKYLQGFLRSVDAKLSNERFMANAKADVIEKEKQKKADAEEKIRKLMGS